MASKWLMSSNVAAPQGLKGRWIMVPNGRCPDSHEAPAAAREQVPFTTDRMDACIHTGVAGTPLPRHNAAVL
jgi:hypothetical protein